MPGVSPTVLCVDLDGTLVRTDTMLEAAFALVRRRPLALFALLAWLVRGRVHFKRRLAEAIALDPATLPYRDELVAYLRAERARGRRIALATASHRATAMAVAAHLRCFDDVHATEVDNLKGARKAEVLERAYGRGGFVYAGDSRADLPVWERSAGAILVDVAPSVRAALGPDVAVERDFPPQASRARELVRALRPHQWVKNVLVFVALVTAHHYLDARDVVAAVAAFVAVCLAASAVYVVNDLVDLAADRAHVTKRRRPFARGTLPLAWGIAAAPVLLAAAAAIALWLPGAFGAGLAGYVVAALVYSLAVKGTPWLDAAWLAGLYTWRIYLGALAIAVPVSNWLLLFSTLAFSSLALMKRFTELRQSAQDTVRGYDTRSLQWVRRVGEGCAVLATLVLVPYVRSDTVGALYRQPHVLWAIVPLTGYLLWRAWREASGGAMRDDPIVYALERRDTYVAAGAMLVAILLAR